MKISYHNIVRKCALIAYFSGIVIHFAAIMPESFKFAMYGVSLIFGIMAIALGYYSCENIKVKTFLSVWILLIMYLLIIGTLRSDFFSIGTSINIFLSQDLRFLMYVGVGIVLADEQFFGDYIDIITKVSFSNMAVYLYRSIFD